MRQVEAANTYADAIVKHNELNDLLENNIHRDNFSTLFPVLLAEMVATAIVLDDAAYKRTVIGTCNNLAILGKTKELKSFKALITDKNYFHELIKSDICKDVTVILDTAIKFSEFVGSYNYEVDPKKVSRFTHTLD